MDIFWLMVSIREVWAMSRCDMKGGGGGVGTDVDNIPAWPCPGTSTPAAPPLPPRPPKPELSSSSWDLERGLRGT